MFVNLKRQGLSISRISELTSFDRKTIRKYLLEDEIPVRMGHWAARPRILDAFEAFIAAKLKAGVWNGVVLYGMLQKEGYKGGYTTVRRVSKPTSVGRRTKSVQAVRRFPGTAPGCIEGQVDWGDLGDVIASDGTKQSISAFVLELGHSRGIFSDVATDQKTAKLSFGCMREPSGAWRCSARDPV